MITVANALISAGDNTLSSMLAFLKSCFLDFTVADAADIILLSLIFFLAFRFLKGRKAGVLLIGILIFMALMIVAYIFELKATHFVFSQIFKIGVIALIIIFQPEIREALEKVGSGSISGIMSFGDQKKKRQMYSVAIDQICSAVGDLANNKTGALIVIGRTTKLDDVIQTGIAINSDVNSNLIRNLFFNKAPLHDGAIVIEDARITAAACLLPLTRRTDIDSDLGTRHRAAVGMSETSDAIVVVVSEETGTISVAFDCELTRDYTSDSLRKFLMSKIVKGEHISYSDNGEPRAS